MANFRLIQFGIISFIFVKDMNYHCANLNTKILIDMNNKNFPIPHNFCTEFLLANFGPIHLGIISNIVS